MLTADHTFYSFLTFLNFSGADSLDYLSVEGLKRAVRHGMVPRKNDGIGHCTACLTGEYPAELDW